MMIIRSFMIIIGPDIILSILANIPNKRISSIIRLFLNLQIPNKNSTDSKIRNFKLKFNRSIYIPIPILTLKWRQAKCNLHSNSLITLKLTNIPLNTFLSRIINSLTFFRLKYSMLTITRNRNHNYNIIRNTFLFKVTFCFYFQFHLCIWLILYFWFNHY
jgi:hypothetical protein